MRTSHARFRMTIRSALLALAGATLVTLIAVAVVGQADAAGARADAADLPAIEQARLQALVDADTATAGSLMADDFELVNPGGGNLSRDDYLGAVEAGFIDYLVFEPASPIDVRRSGDSAVLRFQVSFDLVVAGTRVTHAGWITELYELRRGQWQIVWEQATAVPNNFELFIESLKPPA
jgi:Domain of unknown function (DUF4440)